MAAAEIKGGALLSISSWIDQHFDEERAAAIRAALPPEQAPAFEFLLPSAWYPVAMLDSIWDAVRTVASPGSPAAFVEVAADSGRYIAADHLNGMFRAFLRICVSPETVLEHQARIWGLYFRNIEVNVAEIRRGGGAFTVRNLGSVRYMAAGAIGWLKHLFDTVGTKGLVLEEQATKVGTFTADPLRFTARWNA